MTVATEQLVERIWERDPTVWTGSGEEKWLGWLDEPQRMRDRIDGLLEFTRAEPSIALRQMGGRVDKEHEQQGPQWIENPLRTDTR